MAGAAKLPRPGVEVIQEFRSASPTIVTPTLVSCVVAPFFEVIEVMNSDGTANADAKLADPYEQLELTIPQSSFPSPRGNIDQVNVLEETTRTFFQFGGQMVELSKSQGFLTSFLDPEVATQPHVQATVAEPGGGFVGLDGRTLVLQLDSHTAVPVTLSNLPVSKNVTVTFAAATSGGKISLDEVVEQINALFPGVASNVSSHLRLTSTRYGAHASVVVRETGSANTILGFSAVATELAVGSGFYAMDDGDNDLTSPRLKVYAGTTQKLVSAADAPVITAPNFHDSNLLAGDFVVTDGVVVGAIMLVESDQITMEIEQNLMSADAPFAPRRVWVQAHNLEYPAPLSSEVATLTGTVQTAVAAPAFLVAPAAPTYPVALSESFTVLVAEGGVAKPAETVTCTGSTWTTLAGVIAGINATTGISFEAYPANDVGDEVAVAVATRLGLRTKASNTGSGSSITYVSQTRDMTIGFTSPTYADIGENIRFLPGSYAKVVSAAPYAAVTAAETITLTPTVKGTAKAAETITWAANHATIAAAVADWNAQAKYTRAYRANAAGAELATGTYFAVRTIGENFGTGASFVVSATDSIPTIATGTYTGASTDLNGKTLLWSLDHNPRQYSAILVADEDDGGVSLQSVLNKINELTPGVATASPGAAPFLKLSSRKKGEASKISVATCTAKDLLGFTAPNDVDVGNGRPDPDFAVGLNGEIILQSQLLRDGLTGIPFDAGFAPVMVAYKGLRLDVSPDADNPSLLTFESTDQLKSAAGPISSDNPGALMAFLALLNSPTTSLTAIGVPEVSADAPEGTPLGYAKCADFLETEEVYALATASHNPVVHQTFMAHVTAMSEPEQKGERIYLFNPKVPDRAVSTSVGSGVDANTTSTTNEITVEVNLAPALIAAGIDPNQDINPATGEILHDVYLDLGTDDRYYLVKKVTGGTKLTLRTDFEPGDGNEDAFYSAVELPAGVISAEWSVLIRGDKLLVPGTTTPDYDRIAETVQKVAQTYGNRRGYYVFPDKAKINVSGLEQVVEGYYATGCVAGMIGQLPPQQGFTNYPIVGLTGVPGSSDSFKESQLAVMAAGGVYILIQDADGAPVVCRHQLSTNVTSVETRELSITKAIDYLAKFLRAGLRNYIGRNNITGPFLDKLSVVGQGLCEFAVEHHVVAGASINNLMQDADNPDTIVLDVTADPEYPCNFIRITIMV